MNTLISAALTCAALSLGANAASSQGCPADPGFILETSPTVAIGEDFTACLTAPVNYSAFLVISIEQTQPAQTKFGQLCVGQPLVIQEFTIPPGGELCLTIPVECREDFIGVPVYFQFVAIDPTDSKVFGISNDTTTLLVDGPCNDGPGQIGDTVFCDTNDNGVQDAGEPGIPGVLVTLTCAGPDNVLGTADDFTNFNITGDNGKYLFVDLEPDVCRVAVDPTTVPDGKVLGQCPLEFILQLDAGDAFLDADFCFITPAEIGDSVFCDLDGDGVQDAGEPGIEGVGVNLVCAGTDGVLGTADDFTSFTMTDANGNYLFTDVPPGACKVTVNPATAPPGKIPGDCPLEVVINLQPGASFLDADFCFVSVPATLGDTVFCDNNDNGVQDPGDPGIANVTVNLACAGADGVLGTADDYTDSTTTDADGMYLFEGIPAGSCEVSVDVSTVPDDKVAGACPTELLVTLEAAEVNLDADFCFTSPEPATVGDTVFCDTNGNGTQDAGEPGIAGVIVNVQCEGPDGVMGTADDFIDTTSTDSNGKYLFTNVPAGLCLVRVDVMSVPDDKQVGSCPTSFKPELAPGDVFLDADFCFENKPSEIGDTVFCDNNNNGVQDAGDPGLPGVVVNLLCAGPDGVFGTTDDIEGTQTTDANGNYLFMGLPPGACKVTVDPTSVPDDKLPGVCPDEFAVDLAANDSFLDADFCYVTPATVGDTVYCDDNDNGVQDIGEPGIAGAVIKLLCAGPDGVIGTADDIKDSTVTDGDGFYLFTDVPPGLCNVSVDIGSVPNKTPGVCPTDVSMSLDPGDAFLDADFCFVVECSGLIGDYIFKDVDGDSLQSAGDIGLEGVKVSLLDADGNVIGMTMTDSAGFYVFEGLCAGTYSVEVDTSTVPSNLAPVLCELGNDAELDSNCSPATTTLATNGDMDLSLDFGFGACGECDGKVTELSLLYGGDDALDVVIKDKDSNVVFDGILQPGELFTIVHHPSESTFGSKMKLFTNGQEFLEIHTSCSIPIGVGSVFGDFTVIAGASKNGGFFCDTSNVVCGNGGPKPTQLTMVYTGESCAATSTTQNPDKVECDGDPAFAPVVHIKAFKDSNKVWFEGDVALGEEFVLDTANAGESKFGSATFVTIKSLNGNVLQEIEFHTSCSQPLNLGDQFGSLVLVGSAVVDD